MGLTYYLESKVGDLFGVEWCLGFGMVVLLFKSGVEVEAG